MLISYRKLTVHIYEQNIALPWSLFEQRKFKNRFQYLKRSTCLGLCRGFVLLSIELSVKCAWQQTHVSSGCPRMCYGICSSIVLPWDV